MIVDSAVHPSVRHPDELRGYMVEPWRSRLFPVPNRYFYPAPKSEARRDTASPGQLPGSDPSLLAKRVLDELGADYAVLLPLTRGLLPDSDLASAICTATNTWLADIWLSSAASNGRFKGSIRINPADPARAVREIDTWASHPHMVQIALPMQSHHPYGQRQFRPIWEAAVRNRLPIAIHADGGTGVEYWPTAVGYPTHFIEYATLYPANFVYHLFSFIAEGVFEELPELSVIFADGGFNLLQPLIWRLDKDWRPLHQETPWVTRPPSDYVRDHVRFCFDVADLPTRNDDITDWLNVSDASHYLLFASNYPDLAVDEPDGFLAGMPTTMDQRILGDNACRLFGLPNPSPFG